MKKFKIEASMHKLGRQCASCTIHFEATIEANSKEEAIAAAKVAAKHDETTHQFKINRIKEV